MQVNLPAGNAGKYKPGVVSRLGSGHHKHIHINIPETEGFQY